MTFNGFISRRHLLAGFTTTALAYTFSACRRLRPVPLSEQLAFSGDEFTFALIADPQLGEAHTSNNVHRTSHHKFSRIVDELNQMNPKPRFVVIDGDMVENSEEREIENFLNRAEQLQPPVVLVHGNHDGRYPYREFKQMQKHLNQTEEVRFSFDVGQWHFVSFPCSMNEAFAAETLTWLEQNLRSHQTRPTMVFEHYHLMPQGLTHLEWYTYERGYRHRLINILAKYGNVRYVINGHVHNGIKTSIKTAWTHQGIHFITAPTCTASRSFGEEYPEFVAGLPQPKDKSGQDTGGGYYLLIDVKGDQAQIRGRLVGVADEYIYPNQFKPYQANEDPLWLKRIVEYPANPTLLNPSFDSGLEGWLQPYRYLSDTEPGYVAKSVLPPADPDPNRRAAFLYCREKGQIWAGDEVMEIFQLVQIPEGAAPVFTAHYYPGMLSNGGGYIRLCTYRQDQLSFLMLFDWGDAGRSKGRIVGQNSAYVSTGKQAGPKALPRLGQNKRGLFWQLPADLGRWHTLQVNLQQLYDQAVGANAFATLKPNKLLVTVGVWSLKDKGSHSGALFDDLALDFNTNQPSQVNGIPIQINQTVFQPGFTRHSRKKG